MTISPTDTSPPLERFWTLLLDGSLSELQSLLDPDAAWDDPLHDADSARDAIPRLAAWLQGRTAGTVQHLRTTADDKRVVVEHVLALRDGVVWSQIQRRSEKAATFELATAVVADRSTDPDRYGALRIYFGTWSVLDGQPRVRVGPISPDETAETRVAMDAVPTVRRYFDALATGDPAAIDLFEPDGYFREPANNFACGRDQLREHFEHILQLGGVGIEFRTATRQADRLGIEIQTIVWGTKQMDRPQAGFAIYELGPHGLLQGARVYDSVVPPVA